LKRLIEACRRKDVSRKKRNETKLDDYHNYGFRIDISISFSVCHYSTKKVIVHQFHEHQSLHARHIAKHIESFFSGQSTRLKSLSSFLLLKYGDIKEKRAELQTYFEQTGEHYVKGISLHDERGTIISSTEAKVIGINHGKSEFFTWAEKKENKGNVFFSPLFLEPHSFKFLLAIPLYQEAPGPRHLKPSGKFVGALSFTVDLKEYFSDQLVFFDPEINLDHMWIIDKDGSLFQSEHAEMV
jgi:hypothetical protein